MPQLEDLRQRYILDTSSVVAGARKVEAATKGVTRQQQKMNVLNRELYGSFRLAIRRAGAAAFAVLLGSIYKAIQGFTQFQKEIAEVETLINANTAAIGHFSAEVRRLARVTPLALSDLTKGLYQTISAAVPAEEAIRFLGVAARAAVGGVTEVAVAVDGMTSVLNAFGLEARDAEDIADTFFVSIRDGKTTFAELSKNMGTVAPAAAAVGLSFQELTALMTAMTLAGLSTDKTAVALRGLFKSLEDPADEAIEMAKKLGIEWTAQALLAKGVVPFLVELREKTDAYSGATTVLVGNSRAANGLNALLTNGLDDLARTTANQTERTGEAAEAYRKLNIVGDTTWKVFKNRVADVFQQLGESTFPLVRDAIKGISDALDQLRDPSERIKDVFASLGLEIEGMSDQFDRLLIAENKAKFAGKRFSVGSELRETRHISSQTDLISGTFDTVTVDWGTFKTNVVSKQIAEDFWEGLTNEQRLEKVRGFISEIIDLFTEVKQEEIRVQELFTEGQLPKSERDSILLLLADRSDELKSQVVELNEYRDALEKSIGAEKRLAEKGVSTIAGRPVERPKIPQRKTDTEGIAAALREATSFREKMILASAATEELRDALQSLFDLQKDEGDLTKGAEVLVNELASLKKEEAIFQERLNIALANQNVFSEKEVALSEKELKAKQEQVRAVEQQLMAIFRATEAARTQIDVVENGIKKWILSAEELRDMGFGEELVKSLTGKKGFVEFKNISKETADHFEKVRANLSAIDKVRFDDAVKFFQDAEEFRDAMQDAAEAMSAVARVMRDLGIPDLAGVADSVSGLLSVLPSVKATGLGFGSIAQGATTLSTAAAGLSIGISFANAVAPLFSGQSEAEKQLAHELRRNSHELQKFREEFIKQAVVGEDLTPEDREFARRAFTRLHGTPTLTDAQARDLIQQLVDRGILPEGTVENFDRWLEQGTGTLFDFLREFDISDILFDVFTRGGLTGVSAAGASRDVQFGQQFLGDTIDDSFQRIIDFFERFGEELPEDLRKEFDKISGLDLTNPADRAAFEAFVKSFAESIFAGDTFGMSPEEAERWLDLFQSIVDDFEDVETDGISRSVQIQRTITEIQANELIAIQESALLTLERILDAIRMQDASGNTYNISIDIPADTTDFGRRILEEIEQEIRLKEAS